MSRENVCPICREEFSSPMGMTRHFGSCKITYKIQLTERDKHHMTTVIFLMSNAHILNEELDIEEIMSMLHLTKKQAINLLHKTKALLSKLDMLDKVHQVPTSSLAAAIAGYFIGLAERD